MPCSDFLLFFGVMVFFSSTFCAVFVFGVFNAVTSPSLVLHGCYLNIVVFCFLFSYAMFSLWCFHVYVFIFPVSRKLLQKRSQDMCPRNLFQKFSKSVFKKDVQEHTFKTRAKKYLQEMCPRNSLRTCARNSVQPLAFVQLWMYSTAAAQTRGVYL